MVENAKKKVVIILTGLFILTQFTSMLSVSAATNSDPIRINRNSDFSNHANSGTGSANDPWIIDNLEISGNNTRYCIYVGNTTDYFVIRNCVLYYAELFRYRIEYIEGSAIQLMNAQNGRVADNHISFSGFSIYLNQSSNNVIDGNTGSHNNYGIVSSDSHNNHISNNSIIAYDDIIQLYDSPNTTIMGNVCEGGSYGIYVQDSDHLQIMNNSVLNNGWGIHYFSSNNSFISKNLIENQTYSGVWMDESLNNSLSGNVFINSGIQLLGGESNGWLSHSVDTSNTVNGKPIYFLENIENYVVPNDAGQIFVIECNNITIQDLNITGSSDCPINLFYSSYCTVTNNLVQYNWDGIYLYRSDHNVIKNNNASYRITGVRLLYSNYNVIEDNSVHDASEGVSLFDSNHNLIKNNSGISCWATIYLDSSTNNDICFNSALDSTMNNGIFLQSDSNNNSVYNNTVSGNNYGIKIWRCQSVIVYNNLISKNGDAVYVVYSENIYVFNNSYTQNNRILYQTNSTVFETEPLSLPDNIDNSSVPDNKIESNNVIYFTLTGIVIIVAVIAMMFFIRKKKPKPPTTPTEPMSHQ